MNCWVEPLVYVEIVNLYASFGIQENINIQNMYLVPQTLSFNNRYFIYF